MRARRGRGRRRLGAVVVATCGVVATGCASTAPATGVTRIDRSVVVAYRPCDGDEAIARLALYGSDDLDEPVWEAVRQRGTTQPAVLELPVVARYPGYDITDRRPGRRLDTSQRYSFEATSTEGTEWGGPGFRTGELEQGVVRVAGQELDFDEWVDQPASCPDTTLVGALLTGLVVAAVAGGALLLLRRLTRRGRVVPTDPGATRAP